MLLSIGLRTWDPPPFSLPVPLVTLPGVPITHRASNPTRAFLNFRGTSADESPDLWLADGRWRGGNGAAGRKVIGSASKRRKSLLLFSHTLTGAHTCTALSPSVPLTAGELTGLHSVSHTHILAWIYLFFKPIWPDIHGSSQLWSPPHLFSHIDGHQELSKTWFSHSFFIISKVTLQRLPPSFFFFFLHLHKIFLLFLNTTSLGAIAFCFCDFAYHIIGQRTKEPECGRVHRSIFVYVSGLVPIKLVLYCRGPTVCKVDGCVECCRFSEPDV